MQKSNFNLVSLVVIFLLMGLLTAVLIPAMSSSRSVGSMTSVGTRGKDIYVAIICANTEREPLGLSSVWPKSKPPTNHVDDISQMNFTNSTDYFYALYDGENVGTPQHNPYVRGFDYSKLAGAGVPAHSGKGRLKPKNNMWTIAKNVRETMEEMVPVLVTRNLAAESLVTDLTDPVLMERRLYIDEEWKTPFGNKGFVIVRKGGGTFNIQARYATVKFLYGNQTFQTTLSGSQLLGLCYLTPSKEVIPSEAGYQACVAAAANEKRDKWEDYRWIVERGRELYRIFIHVPIIGLISATFIFLIVFFDKKWKPKLLVMRPAYWFLLWVPVTGYLDCIMIVMLDTMPSYPIAAASVLPFSLVLAFLFQVFGFGYVIACDQRADHPESFKLAMKLQLFAPLIAFLCFLLISCFWFFGHLLLFSVSRLIR